MAVDSEGKLVPFEKIWPELDQAAREIQMQVVASINKTARELSISGKTTCRYPAQGILEQLIHHLEGCV